MDVVGEGSVEVAPMRQASPPSDSADAQLSVVVVTPATVDSFELKEGAALVVGSSPEADIRLQDPKVSPRHLRLRRGGPGLLEVEELKSPFATRLNDVQISATSVARAGDQLVLGDCLLIVRSAQRPLPQLSEPCSRDELEARLFEECGRSLSKLRTFGLLLLRLPRVEPRSVRSLRLELTALAQSEGLTLVWGELGRETVELLFPEISRAAFEGMRVRITAALGAAGLRFQLGHACFPEDGLDRDELLEGALGRLGGRPPSEAEELIFLDPVTVRLQPVIDRLAEKRSAVWLGGGPGSGREKLAKQLHQRSPGGGKVWERVHCQRAGEEALTVELFGTEAVPGAVARARGGTLFLAELDRLPSRLEARLANTLEGMSEPPRVLASVSSALGSQALPAMSRSLLPARVPVPALVDRPSEIVPLAEQFLARCRKPYGRPRLAMSNEFRGRLTAYGWPGNVRELKVTVERAVLATSGDELGPDSLPQRVRRAGGPLGGAGVIDLRSSMQGVEREALLTALASTRWNVTAAAKQLGLPRRTVVYRMSRLGVRRPAR